jgi:hypothetical protein
MKRSPFPRVAKSPSPLAVQGHTMNTNQSTSTFLRLIVFSTIAATAGVAMAQSASADKCVPQMSRLEQRLYQKAGEGPDALRDFIFIRRGIFQLDMSDVERWTGGVDATRTTCLKTVDADVAAPTTAAMADLH